MADSIVLVHAWETDARVVTGDGHFRKIKEALFIKDWSSGALESKPRQQKSAQTKPWSVIREGVPYDAEFSLAWSQ